MVRLYDLRTDRVARERERMLYIMKKAKIRVIRVRKTVLENINNKLDVIEIRNKYLLQNFEKLEDLEHEWCVTHKLLFNSMIYIQKHRKELNEDNLVGVNYRLDEIKFDIVNTMKILNYFKFDDVLLIIKYNLSLE